MARRLPPLNALRAFEASARLGSFVGAAAELHVSAAAVSQLVRRLERYLDVDLFQLVPVTQESWRAPWSYFLVAPPAHFRRRVVRAFVDWALAEGREDATA